MIFDEVDTGISGSASQKVGRKLRQVSKSRHVICVTHSAQIAALADAHFEIEKKVSGGRTYTSVRQLSMEERRTEIARMISGPDATELALQNAGEMLRLGQSV